MALSRKETDIVKQVTKKYGNVIDLNKSPAVLIEILRNFSSVLLGEGGAPSAPPSTMAVGVTPAPPPAGGEAGSITLPAVMKVVLQMQRDVSAIKQTLAQRGR